MDVPIQFSEVPNTLQYFSLGGAGKIVLDPDSCRVEGLGKEFWLRRWAGHTCTLTVAWTPEFILVHNLYEESRGVICKFSVDEGGVLKQRTWEVANWEPKSLLDDTVYFNVQGGGGIGSLKLSDGKLVPTAGSAEAQAEFGSSLGVSHPGYGILAVYAKNYGVYFYTTRIVVSDVYIVIVPEHDWKRAGIVGRARDPTANPSIVPGPNHIWLVQAGVAQKWSASGSNYRDNLAAFAIVGHCGPYVLRLEEEGAKRQKPREHTLTLYDLVQEKELAQKQAEGKRWVIEDLTGLRWREKDTWRPTSFVSLAPSLTGTVGMTLYPPPVLVEDEPVGGLGVHAMVW